ncbi:MAG TPA: HipA domain-containing protein [Mycobacteriales bacterium]
MTGELPPFGIFDVSSWPRDQEEQMGSKRKVWLEEPGRQALHLFKYVRKDRTGRRYGDDWAEKIAAELAPLMGVPVAEVELASRADGPGTISRRMNDPDVVELVHGNELLARSATRYEKDIKREHPLYTVPAVAVALEDARGARAGELASFSAFEVWAGYLVFDAWIANTDRHHENWGVLRRRTTAGDRLAPSFDHGSSLGFNVAADDLSAYRAHPDGVERWCRRGRSGHFAGRPCLVDVAVEALAAVRPAVRKHWLESLDAVTEDRWHRTIARVPDERMSEDARTFVGKVLEINRRRVLDERRAAS